MAACTIGTTAVPASGTAIPVEVARLPRGPSARTDVRFVSASPSGRLLVLDLGGFAGLDLLTPRGRARVDGSLRRQLERWLEGRVAQWQGSLRPRIEAALRELRNEIAADAADFDALSGSIVTDFAGGALWGATAVLGALVGRQQTGEGAHLDISMTEGAMALLAHEIGAVDAGNPAPSRGTATLNGGLACYGVYRCKDDRFVSVGALEPKFWIAFNQALGRKPDVTELMAPPGRQDQIREEIAAILVTRTRDELVTALAQHDCLLEPVLELDDVPPYQRRAGLFGAFSGPTWPRAPRGCSPPATARWWATAPRRRASSKAPRPGRDRRRHPAHRLPGPVAQQAALVPHRAGHHHRGGDRPLVAWGRARRRVADRVLICPAPAAEDGSDWPTKGGTMNAAVDRPSTRYARSGHLILGSRRP
jgi:hypothetical protein